MYTGPIGWLIRAVTLILKVVYWLIRFVVWLLKKLYPKKRNLILLRQASARPDPMDRRSG